MNIEDREELLSFIDEPFPRLNEQESRIFIHQNTAYDHNCLNICQNCFQNATELKNQKK
jgi:hypothetical protein